MSPPASMLFSRGVVTLAIINGMKRTMIRMLLAALYTANSPYPPTCASFALHHQMATDAIIHAEDVGIENFRRTERCPPEPLYETAMLLTLASALTAKWYRSHITIALKPCARMAPRSPNQTVIVQVNPSVAIP